MSTAECLGGCGLTRQAPTDFWCPACKKKYRAYLGVPVLARDYRTLDLARATSISQMEQRLRDGFKTLGASGDR